MSEQNHSDVGRALNYTLRPMLTGLVGQQLSKYFGSSWWRRGVLFKLNSTQKKYLPISGSYEQLTDKLDASLCLLLITDIHWNEIFSQIFPRSFFHYFKELQGVRNSWAHNDETDSFTDSYTARAFDTMILIADEIDGDTAEKLRELKEEFTDRISAQSKFSSPEDLKPWCDVMVPHPDVTAGEYIQAEWAVNLSSVVFERKGRIEYTEPVEFFSRTYVTDGLKRLLVSVLRRVTNGSGEPVIQLKTSFGGGKTHSLLALYHLFGGRIEPEKSSAVREILSAAKVESLPEVTTAVFVGTWSNSLSSTMWGEIAEQLANATGKPELYEMMRENDKQKIPPGSALLQKLFEAAGSCLILIDEFVAYGRQLNREKTDALMSFVQQLTEAVTSSERTALVVSIPQSEAEVGGAAGKRILAQLEKIFGRVEFVWTPVSGTEGYEIVRRRLFSRCDESARTKVCEEFYRMYVENPNDFPYDTRQSDYKNKLLSCYPIHPKLFDFFYSKWTGLENFQKTRGVLRLMAKVIYNLWQRGDDSAMIMPCDMPLDAADVNAELTKNLLGGNWNAIVDSEVDGTKSKPAQLDELNTRFSSLKPSQKISRSIFMGTAPDQKVGGVRGVTEDEIHLCTLQPKNVENIAVFNDALTKLRTNLYYLHSQGSSCWFSDNPTLRRLVDDKRAKYSEAEIFSEIEKRLKTWKIGGKFHAVHICPKTTGDVPDEETTRLVILSPSCFYGGWQNTDATAVAKKFLDECGTTPRRRKNLLLFLAADAENFAELKDTVRELKAWSDILGEKKALNLDSVQIDDVNENIKSATKTFTIKVSQVYSRLLYPVSDDEANLNLPLEVAQIECTNEDNISAASDYFTRRELLLTGLGGKELKRQLDKREFIWRDNGTVELKQLWEYFSTYYYMPRLADEEILHYAAWRAVSEKIFALADDENLSGLRWGNEFNGKVSSKNFLVKAEVAQKFFDAEKNKPDEVVEPVNEVDETIDEKIAPSTDKEPEPIEEPEPLPTKFLIDTKLDPARYGKQIKSYVEDMAKVLTSNYPTATASIRLTIKVSVPEGIAKDVQDDIEYNCRDAGLTDFRFTR